MVGQCWTCGRIWTHVVCVDRESLAATRMMQTSEKVEVNLSQKKSEACGSLDMERNSRRRKRCRNKYWAHEDPRDDFSGIRKVVRDEFSKLFRTRGE